MKELKPASEMSIDDKVAIALKKAAAGVVRDHLRTGEPLVLWQDGKMVKLPPNELTKEQLDALGIEVPK